MPGAERLPGRRATQLPSWFYISNETLATPSNTALNLPSTASAVTIASEGGPCYFGINVAAASVTSPGYVALGGVQTIGPIANLTGIRVHAPAATVHVIYWREA